MISVLSKMMERAILFNNYDILRKAVTKIYLGPYRTLDEEVSEAPLDVPQNIVDVCESQVVGEAWFTPKPTNQSLAKQGKNLGDVDPRQAEFARLDSLEQPPEFRFFTQINELPTTVSIGIQGRSSELEPEKKEDDDKSDRKSGLRTIAKGLPKPKHGTVQRRIIIGAKCAPTIVEDLTNIFDFMEMTRSRWSLSGYFQKIFTRTYNSIMSKLPAVYKRFPSVLVNSPTVFEFGDADFLSRKLARGDSSSKPANWGTVTIFSRRDFDENTFEKNINAYGALVKGGWGDMIIVDDDEETVYMCIARDRSAYPIKYGHIKTSFNLEDILDDRDPYKTGTRSFGQVGMTTIKNVIAKLSAKE